MNWEEIFDRINDGLLVLVSITFVIFFLWLLYVIGIWALAVAGVLVLSYLIGWLADRYDLL